MWVCVCVRECFFIHIYIYTHINIYIFIYINIPNFCMCKKKIPWYIYTLCKHFQCTICLRVKHSVYALHFPSCHYMICNSILTQLFWNLLPEQLSIAMKKSGKTRLERTKVWLLSKSVRTQTSWVVLLNQCSKSATASRQSHDKGSIHLLMKVIMW